MKQLTPEFFLRTSFDKNIKPLGGGLDFDEGMQENGFDWVFEAMQAYAEHCEESSWVTDGSLPPVDGSSYFSSVEVLIEHVNGKISQAYCNTGPADSEMYGLWFLKYCQVWVKNEKIKSWRPLPTPPKK